MLAALKRFWNEHPLLALLLLALIPRLVAAFFSRGYAMHDDHFGPIEQPSLILKDISYWTSRTTPHGHSIVYPFMHFVLFKVLIAFGLNDPQGQMIIVRLIHALYSLLVVVLGYRIAQRVSTEEIARKAGFMLALFWALPFLGVRNLIEVICIPPLMAGFYYVLKSEEGRRNAFLAGACFALAFVFRYQTLTASGFVGVVLLFQRRFKDVLLVAAGFAVAALVVQGSADTFAWGYPFASFIEYVRYNATHGEDYTTGPWYNYILLILGALIPPVSFFFVYGFFRNWRKTLLILIPVLVFFVLHSYFPNKQERFILPVLPLIIVLGMVGWEEYVRQSPFWSRHRGLLRGLWAWFWTVNVVLLVLFSTYYGRRSRVEAMSALYGKPVHGVIEVSGKVGFSQPPYYYAGVFYQHVSEVANDADLAHARGELDSGIIRDNIVIFYGDDELGRRVRWVEDGLRMKLTFISRAEPSLMDYVFYRLNPRHNKNEVLMVYEGERVP
jgi:hypothetical protein